MELKFDKFLADLEALPTLPTNTTAAGLTTIEQTPRNEMRRQGLVALTEDLKTMYPNFDIVNTSSGIVIVAENAATGQTISWELACTIKSLSYDPFIAADQYDDLCKRRLAAHEAAAAKQKTIEEKRATLAAKLSPSEH